VKGALAPAGASVEARCFSAAGFRHPLRDLHAALQPIFLVFLHMIENKFVL
jgi:hypothetical protein